MKKTVDHEKMRQSLIDAAKTVVYRYGIEGCTSKKIATESKLNEAYIFRYFLDLKDLRKKTFFQIEKNLFFHLAKSLEVNPPEENDYARKIKVFEGVWNILLSAPADTLYFIRYYLSTESAGDVQKEHLENCRRILLSDRWTPEEKEQKLRIGNATLMVVFQYAALVCTGFLDNSPETRQLVIKNII